MIDVIDFLFDILGNLWVLITSSWLMSFAIIVVLLDYVVSLYLSSRQE